MALAVAAVGQAPLAYQWKFNGTNLVGETNSFLILPVFGQANVGSYGVIVSNGHGSDESLPAMLTATNSLGGGYIAIGNRVTLSGYAPINSPVNDVDGVTKLTGANYVAQAYAGPDEANLLPLGAVATFFTPAPLAGAYGSATAVIPNVASGDKAYVQIRVWERAKGATYEQAQFSGGALANLLF